MAAVHVGVVVLGLVSFALVAVASPQQLPLSGGLFMATSGDALWTYPNPMALAKLEAQVVPVPPLSGLNPKLVAAAASGEPGGSFTVVTTNAMAVQRSGRNFTRVDFGGESFLFTDVAYVPSSGVIVAVALQPTSWGNLVAFLRSEDDGLTWTRSYAERYTDGTSCSISLSLGLGIVVCDTLVFNSFDDARTWKLSWEPRPNVRVHKAAILAPGLGLITGGNTAWLWPKSGSLWYSVPLPIRSSATVTGLALIEEETWLVATSTGQVWRTELGGSRWDLVLARANITWTDMTHNGGVVLAVGRYALSFGHEGGGVAALSWDAGKEWVLSPPLPDARFTRVVPGAPSTLSM